MFTININLCSQMTVMKTAAALKSLSDEKKSFGSWTRPVGAARLVCFSKKKKQ